MHEQRCLDTGGGGDSHRDRGRATRRRVRPFNQRLAVAVGRRASEEIESVGSCGPCPRRSCGWPVARDRPGRRPSGDCVHLTGNPSGNRHRTRGRGARFTADTPAPLAQSFQTGEQRTSSSGERMACWLEVGNRTRHRIPYTLDHTSPVWRSRTCPRGGLLRRTVDSGGLRIRTCGRYRGQRHRSSTDLLRLAGRRAGQRSTFVADGTGRPIAPSVGSPCRDDADSRGVSGAERIRPCLLHSRSLQAALDMHSTYRAVFLAFPRCRRRS